MKSEAEFLLHAVYGMYSMSKGIRWGTTGEELASVQRAINAFEAAAPDADLLRHLHVHMDHYLRGEGHDADRLSDPSETAASL
jgi:hypothetical protein